MGLFSQLPLIALDRVRLFHFTFVKLQILHRSKFCRIIEIRRCEIIYLFIIVCVRRVMSKIPCSHTSASIADKILRPGNRPSVFGSPYGLP